jgi:hypothetical protein
MNIMCLLRRDGVRSGGLVPTFQTEGSVSLRSLAGRREDAADKTVCCDLRVSRCVCVHERVLWPRGVSRFAER